MGEFDREFCSEPNLEPSEPSLCNKLVSLGDKVGLRGDLIEAEDEGRGEGGIGDNGGMAKYLCIE